MIKAFTNSWALFLGIFLLMIGNGVQGTLLGIRGGMEGFSTFHLSLVMSAYFAGYLGGSQLAPSLIRRVGHVRVFAALGSFISAVLILYPAITEPWAWIVLRMIFGFCMCGVYVTAESWLNSGATNDMRGQTLSIYLVVQMAGLTAAQALPGFGDPSGFILFVIPSVLVSISFAPILLSVAPTPPFASAKRMRIIDLFRLSPLGCVGVMLMGLVYSAMYGMAAVYATQMGFSVGQVSTFIAAIFLGGLIFQFPIGWLSDRLDRRMLILAAAAASVVFALAETFGIGYVGTLVAVFLLGGVTNPLYGLILAHTNDFLEYDDMASASGQLLFLNGAAAVAGPILAGLVMNRIGPSGFFIYIAVVMAVLAIYAAYRMTQRRAPKSENTGDYAPVLPTASVMTMEAAQEGYGDEEGDLNSPLSEDTDPEEDEDIAT